MLTIDPSKIKKYREKKGISQEYLAEKLNMTQSSYAKIEGGKRRIEASVLFRIAQELDEKIENFLADGFAFLQQGNHKFKDSLAFTSATTQNVYCSQKEPFEEQIKLLREEIAEMRKERQELIALLKGKL